MYTHRSHLFIALLITVFTTYSTATEFVGKIPPSVNRDAELPVNIVNFIFASYVSAKTATSLYTHRSPIDVKVKVLGMLPNLKGFRLSATLKSPEFKKLLSSGAEKFELQMSAEFDSCDGEKVVNQVQGKNAQALVDALAAIEYRFNPYFNCIFNISNISLGDTTNLVSFDYYTNLYFGNTAALVPSVFSRQRFTGENFNVAGVMQMHIVEDSRILFFNRILKRYDNPAYDTTLYANSLAVANQDRKSSIDTDKYIESASIVSETVNLLDDYRKAIVVSASLEPAHREAYLYKKMQAFKSQAESTIPLLGQNIAKLNLPQKVLALRILKSSLDDIMMAERSLNLINDANPGIESLNIEQELL